jgi:periodic tryptophan protein 1
MSMITAGQWVPRGVAAQFPTKYHFDEEEYSRIAEIAKLQLDDANEDLEEAREEDEVVEDEPAPSGSGSGKKEKKSKKKAKAAEQEEYVEGPVVAWHGTSLQESGLLANLSSLQKPQD